MSEPRFETSTSALFELGSWRGEGRIENAGLGGLFVGAATIPKVGEKVWLSFDDPEGDRVEATGVVWWTTLDSRVANRKGFGVRLVGTGEAYDRYLREVSRRR
jgi:Tfp pilus assembly protein PilZ